MVLRRSTTTAVIGVGVRRPQASREIADKPVNTIALTGGQEVREPWKYRPQKKLWND